MSALWTMSNLSRLPSQAGKRFLVTGGNSGVGYYAAVELARRGAVLLLACRDARRGQDALKQLTVDAQGPESAAQAAELVELDLASLESVQRVAEDELARGLPLDGLINNAGVMAPPERRETRDGFELQFGTHVLGHFALTCRLLPVLEMAAASRVVTLASIAHKRGKIAFDDLQSERSYSPMGAYQQSKLGDLMFAMELERRLRADGKKTISIAVHPGVAKTRLFKVGSSEGISAHLERGLQSLLGVLFNSGEEGALPTIFAATSPQAQGGHYYGPQGLQEMRGGDVGEAFVSAAAQDEAARRRLWTVCAELTGVDLQSY
jgi:NAD(P)-dependent dehydrogenase (short-subunit alcohol dehydrogenase family)